MESGGREREGPRLRNSPFCACRDDPPAPCFKASLASSRSSSSSNDSGPRLLIGTSSRGFGAWKGLSAIEIGGGTWSGNGANVSAAMHQCYLANHGACLCAGAIRGQRGTAAKSLHRGAPPRFPPLAQGHPGGSCCSSCPSSSPSPSPPAHRQASPRPPSAISARRRSSLPSPFQRGKWSCPTTLKTLNQKSTTGLSNITSPPDPSYRGKRIRDELWPPPRAVRARCWRGVAVLW